jgi:hypothetical protein
MKPHKIHEPPKTLVCIHCKKQFTVPASVFERNNTRYCSRSCYFAHRWNANGECANCKKPSKTKFCSPLCQREFWNKNGYKLGTKQRYWKQKRELMALLGNKCSRCGFDDLRALEINHVDRTRKLFVKGQHHSWTRRLKDWHGQIDNLELLCANCHSIHTFEQMGYARGITI